MSVSYIWHNLYVLVVTWFFQVHLLLNGSKEMIIVIFWSSRCSTLKAFQRGNGGHHNHILFLTSQNQGLWAERLHTLNSNSSFCIERLHILSSNSSCNTTTIISPANQFLCPSRLSLRILPQVVDLSRLLQINIPATWMFHMLPVDPNCHLHQTSLHSLTLSCKWLGYIMGHSMVESCLSLLLVYPLIAVQLTSGQTRLAYMLETILVLWTICCNNSYLIKMG